MSATPIPPRNPGYRFGSSDAPVQVDVFIDLQCPFSAKIWKTLSGGVVKKHTDSKEVSFVIFPMCLPWHRQVVDMTKAALVVSGDNAQRWFDFATYLYDRQNEFLNAEFKNKTENDLLNLLAAHAIKFSSETKQSQPALDAAAWVKQFESDEAYNRIKYPIRVAIKRGVWSTPTVFINGSAADIGSSTTAAEWDAAIAKVNSGYVPLAAALAAEDAKKKAAAAAAVAVGASSSSSAAPAQAAAASSSAAPKL